MIPMGSVGLYCCSACPGLIPGAYEYFTPLGHKDVEMEPGAKMS